MLRDELKRDDKDRLYVDGFLLSHPDDDHICGLERHFHLGPPEDWNEADDKIIIREMLSSPIVFRRASTKHVLGADAKAWAKEARRRVKLYRDTGWFGAEGDRIQIMGEDADGKTDDITPIVVKADETFSAINRRFDNAFEARLIGPRPHGDDEELERTLAKNDSSVVVRFSIRGDGYADKCRFLTGGDAGVAIWERIWKKLGTYNADWLSYDVLLSPHHCSWRSLSYDSYSEKGEEAAVCDDARSALAQTRKGAIIVASSKTIDPDDADPPSDRAKREYVAVVDGKDDRFLCVADVWADEAQPLTYKIGSTGVTKVVKSARVAAAAALGIGATSAHARPHGSKRG